MNNKLLGSVGIMTQVFSMLLMMTLSSLLMGQSLKIKYGDYPDGKGTFTVPSCVTKITIEVWGGGGGGGFRDINSSSGTTGGGGGAYSRKTITVNQGEVYQFEIGKGGAKGDDDSGKKGGNTTFSGPGMSGVLLKANGGNGAKANTTDTDRAIGGAAETDNSVISYKGGDGGLAYPQPKRSGGGGGAGHYSGAGGNATAETNGSKETEWVGGSSISDGGSGANGALEPKKVNADGADGAEFGGGGSGGWKVKQKTNIAVLGGAGGNGGVIITYNVNPAPTASVSTIAGSICAGSTIDFTISGTSGAVVTYNLNSGTHKTVILTGGTATITVSNAITTQTLNLVSVSNASCVTVLSTSAIKDVNPLPTLTGASQAAAVCAGSGATINLTGLLPNSTSTINYTINGTAQTPVTGVVANASGAGSFNSVPLSVANNYQTLKITSVTATNLTPSCTSSFSYNFGLQVIQNYTPRNIRGDNESCNGYIARWDGEATNFYIDVATTNTFDPLTIVPTYNNAVLGNVKSVNLTGLLPNTKYYFRVRAFGSCGLSSNSSTGTFTTLSISIPTGIQSYNATCSGATVQWDGSATKFYLDVATSNTFSAGTILSAYNNKDVGTSNIINVTGLSPNTIYYFRVRRQEPCGLSSNSSTGTFTTLSISIPTGVQSYNPTCSGATIQWAGSATKFYLDIATSNTFSSGTILSAYDNKDVGTSNSINVTGLSPNATYYFRVRRQEPCGLSSNSSTGTFTTLSISIPTGVQSYNPTCSGATIRWDGSATKFYLDVATSNTFSAGTILLAYNNKDVGTSNSITITGLFSNTTYYFRVRRLEVCGLSGNSNTGNFATSTGIAQPLISAINQPNCLNSNGTFSITNYNSSYSYTISPSTGVSRLKDTITAPPGTYTLTVSNGSCSAILSSEVVINSVITNTWNGMWSAGKPTLDQAIIFNNDFNSTADLEGCSCKVNGDKIVVFNSGHTLKIANHIDVSENGSLTFENNANLIQVNENAVNTGNVTVKRESPMKKNDYTYWSSPVSGQKLYGFSPLTSTTRFYEYNEADDMFYSTGINASSVFKPGKGYAIMAPSSYTFSLQTFKGEFIGIPNNGTSETLQFPLKLTTGLGYSDKGYNLIGNPYPSNIDFEKLHTLNSTKIYNTAYFWTNVDPNRRGSTNGTGSEYSGNAYAIYNGTGGVPATTPKDAPAGAPNGGLPPTQFIKVGQGFIVKAKKVDNLTFNNTVRNAVGTSIFFSKDGVEERDRYWLKLTTPSLDVNTILIGYVAGATNDFEWDYDAPLLSVGSDSFYSLLNYDTLGIQGRSYPLKPQDIVRLGTKHFEWGNYTISLGEREGIFAERQSIYLKDNLSNTVTNLSEGNYIFTAKAGVTDDRFEIIYQPEAVLVTDSKVKEGIIVYRDLDHFVIKSPKVMSTVHMYDSSGKLITVLKPNSKQEILDALNISNGIYILKITTPDGEVTNKKIMK